MSIAWQGHDYDTITVASNAPPKMVNKQTRLSLHLLDTKYGTHEQKVHWPSQQKLPALRVHVVSQ